MDTETQTFAGTGEDTVLNRDRNTGQNNSERNQRDLDSLEIGTPGGVGKIKVYFNTEVHNVAEIQRRIDLQIEAIQYAKERQNSLE